MMSFKYLLASHGSVGAIEAERAALRCCKNGDQLDHLYVIPSWWGDMTGDDWLNNGVSRNRFRNYLSEQLWQESQQVIQRLRQLCNKKAIEYNSLFQVGRSDKALQQVAAQTDYVKIFIGDRRPKHTIGLYDYMLTASVRKQLATRLNIISYPHE